MMTSKTHLAVCVSALALMTTPASASGDGNYVKNNQSNWAETRAELNAGLENITGDVTVTAAAISNSFSAELSGDTVVNNEQFAGYDTPRVKTSAELNIYPEDALHSLEGTAAAITNSASIEVTDEVSNTWINNRQYSKANTFADLNATLHGVDGDVELTAAALGNSLSVTGELPVGMNNRQTSRGKVTADLNIHQQDIIDGDLTATAAAIGNSADISWTEGGIASSLNNRQHLSGNVYSELELYGSGGVTGAVELSNTAIANTISVEGTGDYYAHNHQTFFGDVHANTTVILEDVGESVNVTTAAIGNSASYDLADANHVSITNWQRANIDPTATAYVEIDGVGDDVEITTAAIANTLSVSTLPNVTGLTIDSRQENHAYTSAITTVDLANVVGDVTLTSAAIGNSVNISNIPN